MSTTVAGPVPAPPVHPWQLWLADGGRRVSSRVVLPLLLVAGLAWVLTVRSAGAGDDMAAAASFVPAWLVMMLAMMLPAVAPVVGLYALAARRGTVAALPVFLAGYLLVWCLSAAPAYLGSRAVAEPLMDGRPWVGRLAGIALLTAAAYQLTPVKATCLRHCRSPMGFFLTRTTSLARPSTALRAGVAHGLYCLGCCWAAMGVLVVLGGMQLGWALGLAAVISVEKLAPWGEAAGRGVAAVALGLGLALLVSPALLARLVSM